jgi:hypothetical protein
MISEEKNADAYKEMTDSTRHWFVFLATTANGGGSSRTRRLIS